VSSSPLLSRSVFIVR